MARDTKQSLIGKEIQPVLADRPSIGIDTDDTLISNLVDSAVASSFDISKIENFSTVSQTREQLYQMVDNMAQDPILASYLRTISEDAVEPNDSGQIIWAESSDAQCSHYITYILDSLQVDKKAYGWMHSLAKYGDLYVRLYRKSDYEDEELFSKKEADKRAQLNEAHIGLSAEEIQQIDEDFFEDDLKKESLEEAVKVKIGRAGDRYVNYIEAVHNPGEMFELTRHGKTMGYIQAPTQHHNVTSNYSQYSFMQYKLNRKDVTVYSATDFVHASLKDTSNRTPEEVDILRDPDNPDNVLTYKVRRGQSELSNVFKIWRQLTLLENSALLNRITKSSVTRTVSVEVGDMPKEQVAATLQGVKTMMEQKMALNTDQGVQEYTNPGPVENNVYFATRGGVGAVTASTIGGDFDPKQLTDLSYFQDKLFGALGVPKAFFGITDDGAGFNGGTSLAIQSSRYGKSVKRIQNVVIQMVTDLVNLFLLDRGLIKFVNKFTIRMQTPVTQEEIDRRDNKRNQVGVISDIMNQLGDIDDPIIRLKIIKSLLSEAVSDSEIISLIQEHIVNVEKAQEEAESDTEGGEETFDSPPITATPPRMDEPTDIPTMPEVVEEPEIVPDVEAGVGDEESFLPSPDALGIDMTVNQ